MSTKSSRRSPETAPQAQQLQAIERLLASGDRPAAQQRLSALRREFPQHGPLYARQIELLREDGDLFGAALLAHDWTDAEPTRARSWRTAHACYAAARLPGLAWQAAGRLRELDVHSLIAQQDEVALLESLPAARRTGSGDQLAAAELGRLLFIGARFEAAVEALAGVAARPSPSLRGITLFNLDRMPEAFEQFAHQYARDPGDSYAAEWLVRMHLLKGEEQAARALLPALLAIVPESVEEAYAHWRGLLLLGAAGDVVAAYPSVRDHAYWSGGTSIQRALLLNLAGVALASTANEALAREAWREAQDEVPRDLAEFNLANLLTSADLREAPSLQDWVEWLPRTLNGPLNAAAGSRDGGELAIQLARLRAWPAASSYWGLVFRHSDPRGRELALMMLRDRIYAGEADAARVARELLALRGGQDAARRSLLRAVVYGGFSTPGESVPVLQRGIVGLVQLPPARIDAQADDTSLSQELRAGHHTALRHLAEGKPEAAALSMNALLKQAPNHPVLLYNQAAIEALRQKLSLAEQEPLLRRVLELDPDYLFARCRLAELHAKAGDMTAARKCLDGLEGRPVLRPVEARALYRALSHVAAAAGDDVLSRQYEATHALFEET